MLYVSGDFDGALAYQERVAALDPKEVQMRLELGFNYLNHQDRASDAVRVLAEAVALEPSAKNLTFLAQSQFVSGDVAAAEESLRQAIETDATHAHAYMVLIQLLDEQERTDDAQEVREAAATAGVTLEQ
jgi:Tfp pilus assembly protein PilF